MKRKFLIAPSLLSADLSNLAQEMCLLEKAGCDWFHLDVMDGHFVPNLTFGAPLIRCLRSHSKKIFDCHLMIEQPERSIQDFLDVGCDILTIHIEATTDPFSIFKRIRSHGKKAGVTLKPMTPVEHILPLLPFVDLVLVMTVNPGFSGQQFMPEQVKKIKTLRQSIEQQALSVLIEVDGGVDDQTAQALTDADVLVSGSYIFKQDYQTAIAQLQHAGV